MSKKKRVKKLVQLRDDEREFFDKLVLVVKDSMI